MNFDEIQAVLSVYQFRNFFDAANHNSVSPSTLSKQVCHVEQELGVQLFERATKKKEAELTNAGKTLVPYIERMATVMAEAKVVAKTFSENETFDFRIGHSPSIGTLGEAKLFSDFIVRNPSFRIHFVPEMSTKLVEYLYNGIVDALILTVPEWDLIPGSELYGRIYNPAIEMIELRRIRNLMFATSRDGDFSNIDVLNWDNKQLLFGKTLLLNNRSPYIKYVDRIKKLYGVTDEIGTRFIDFDKAGLVHTILIDNPDMLAPFIGTITKRQYLWKNISVSDWNITTYQYLVFLKTNKSKPVKALKEEAARYIEMLDTTGIVLKHL